MIKIKKYLGNETYMFPNGSLATPEIMQAEFPAILTFPHIIETDENEQICWAVNNLSAMRSVNNIAKELTEEEAISEIERIRNTTQVVSIEPSAEERIAAALEYQNMMSM
ncbi:MAG: hypothetical protein VB064_03095 [Oscillospiraceae bacterium]|nr:hypothetical protein [Oscillospiraceae bacterium]